ncbi:hypothetical protein MNB_ARC-1_1284 [hydrothermal vent metagenome]|uniref:Uncharacterized protein n=1 Tax=hydrothermal vent metagenome TaxID=652676 RepID=A0A3B1E6J8_9ZZZZ
MKIKKVTETITNTADKITSTIGDGFKSLTNPINDYKYIKDKNKEIERIMKEADKKTAPFREKINKKLEEFGNVKIEIIDTTINKFSTRIKDIKNFPFNEIENKLAPHKNLSFSKKDLDDMQVSVLSVKKILKGGTGGAIAGAGIAGATYATVAAFGAASTGTVISSLSGAAATNATLAWLGGGALAAGGGGMALGAIVLGGIAVVPIASILIYKGKFDYTEERKQVDQKYKEAILFSQKMDEFIKNFDDTIEFINNTIILVKKFASECNKLNHQTEHIIEQIGKNYENYNNEQKKLIQKNVTFIAGLSAFLNTNIMNDNGTFNRDMGYIVKTSDQFLKEAGEHIFIEYKKKTSIWIYIAPILICCSIAAYFYFKNL